VLTRANTCQLRCTNFDALADALHAFAALTHLDVSQNELSTHGVRHLAARLATGPALRSLELINCARANHTHVLATGLGRCPRLARVRLNYNSIGCAHAAEYARSLQLSRTLVLLDLTGNSVYNPGATDVAKTLPLFTALAHLVLPYNHIGYLGAAALLAHAAHCPSLVFLDLSHNLVGRTRDARVRLEHKKFVVESPPDNAFPAMLAAAAACTALRRLNLAHNYLSDAQQLSLHAAWGDARDGLNLVHSPFALGETVL
jgi:Ran GTPase-activating protein (RanGAP) involved in mRNA processing and transport